MRCPYLVVPTEEHSVLIAYPSGAFDFDQRRAARCQVNAKTMSMFSPMIAAYVQMAGINQ